MINRPYMVDTGAMRSGIGHAGERLFFLINVVDAHEGAGEGGDFAEGYEEGFVDLALGVDEDAAIEHYEAADTEEGGGEELDSEFVFHIFVVRYFSGRIVFGTINVVS